MTDRALWLLEDQTVPPANGEPLVLAPECWFVCEEVEAVAENPGQALTLSTEAARAVLRRCVEIESGRHERSEQAGQANGALLDPGSCPEAPEAWVRAAMFLRVITLAKGLCGVTPGALAGYLDLLLTGLTPVVPLASLLGPGNPLAYAARVLEGEGSVVKGGIRQPAAVALPEAGIAVCGLSPRDALGLSGGNPFANALAALAVARGRRLLTIAEGLTDWLARSGAVPAQARETTVLIGAAQVLGTCLGKVDSAALVIEAELNGTGDGFGGEVFEGNDQKIAFAADAVNASLTEATPQVQRLVRILLDRSGRTSTRGIARSVSPSVYRSPKNTGRLAVATRAAHRALAQTEKLARRLADLGCCLARQAVLEGGSRMAAPPWFPRWSPVTPPTGLDFERLARRWLSRATPLPAGKGRRERAETGFLPEHALPWANSDATLAPAPSW